MFCIGIVATSSFWPFDDPLCNSCVDSHIDITVVYLLQSIISECREKLLWLIHWGRDKMDVIWSNRERESWVKCHACYLQCNMIYNSSYCWVSSDIDKSLFHDVPNLLSYAIHIKMKVINRQPTHRTKKDHMMTSIKWKHFPRYWPFVRGIHPSPVNSPHKGQWRGALMFSLIFVWINGWVNNREAGDLRHYRAHYGVTAMGIKWTPWSLIKEWL